MGLIEKACCRLCVGGFGVTIFHILKVKPSIKEMLKRMWVQHMRQAVPQTSILRFCKLI